MRRYRGTVPQLPQLTTLAHARAARERSSESDAHRARPATFDPTCGQPEATHDTGTRVGTNSTRASFSTRARAPAAWHAAQRGVPELSAYQLTLLDTVTGSPTNGVTRVRATALSTHERMDVGGAAAPKWTELGTPDGAYVATI